MKKTYPILIKDTFYNKKNEIIIGLKQITYHYLFSLFTYDYRQMFRNNHSFIPEDFFYDSLKKYIDQQTEDDIIIVPLGHASIYIYFGKKGFLIDPLIDSCSIFFKRYSDNIPIHFLPTIDYVIYSHNHPDHYNKDTLKKIISLFPEITVVGPTNFKSFLSSENISEVTTIELSWWEKLQLLTNISIYCTPAIHWSQSNMRNKNKILWCSWIFYFEKTTIFFCGDSAYGNHFKEIIEDINHLDIAILPIAPNKPDFLQKDSHLNTEDAYQVFVDLKRPIFIPFHWGVFAYGDEDIKEPIEKIINLFVHHNQLEKLKSTTINLPYIHKIKK